MGSIFRLEGPSQIGTGGGGGQGKHSRVTRNDKLKILYYNIKLVTNHENLQLEETSDTSYSYYFLGMKIRIRCVTCHSAMFPPSPPPPPRQVFTNNICCCEIINLSYSYRLFKFKIIPSFPVRFFKCPFIKTNTSHTTSNIYPNTQTIRIYINMADTLQLRSGTITPSDVNAWRQRASTHILFILGSK